MKILKFLASLRLAVFIILGIAAISAVGTIYEARYDSEVAQKLVYHSVWMYIVMGALIVNLVAVMVDRWPWKQHHAGFVTAHIGIIILLFGSWITQQFGVDGTMSFMIGEERRHVVVHDRDLSVLASFDGNTFQEVYNGEPDFLKNPPTEKHPFIIQLGQDEMRFVEYQHFAFRESEILASERDNDPPAIRFQLENPNVNVTEWLRLDSSRPQSEIDLGPAKVVLAQKKPEPSGRNEIVVIYRPGSEKLDYVIYNKDKSLKKTGTIQQAETVETGWMGLKLRLLRYLPHARETVKYVPSGSSPLATSAVRFKFRGEEYWLGLNASLKIYFEDRMYRLTYGHKYIELAFPLRLKEFNMGKYEGTDRASSYESKVEVPERGLVTISMNEPLHYNGFTFYQASFEKDEMGKPVASILSVNRDPGRWIKYIGSMLMVLGSILLFWFKRVQWFKKRKS
jgi:cytochrome c biogenesis protein ResB